MLHFGPLNFLFRNELIPFCLLWETGFQIECEKNFLDTFRENFQIETELKSWDSVFLYTRLPIPTPHIRATAFFMQIVFMIVRF